MHNSFKANWRKKLFHPLTVLAAALVAAAFFALGISLSHSGIRRTYLLFYFLPVGIPFVAFLFDRAEKWEEETRLRWALDCGIVVMALARTFMTVPVSGHALFLSYAMLSGRSWVLRISALLVLIQVIYLKLFVWHDLWALFGGILAGYAAALVFCKLPVAKQRISNTRP